MLVCFIGWYHQLGVSWFMYVSGGSLTATLQPWVMAGLLLTGYLCRHGKTQSGACTGAALGLMFVS